MRAPGIPWAQNQGQPPLATPLNPTCVVLHRTIGHWAGDYGVLARARVPSVHFLIGQDQGQEVQMVDSNVIANHAAGANTKAVGIEFSGQNGEPLTDWQLAAGGALIRWLSAAHNIPLTYFDGPRIFVDVVGFNGFLNHRNVAYPPQTSLQHDDYVTGDEFTRMTEEDDLTAEQAQQLNEVHGWLSYLLKGAPEGQAPATFEGVPAALQTLLHRPEAQGGAVDGPRPITMTGTVG